MPPEDDAQNATDEAVTAPQTAQEKPPADQSKNTDDEDRRGGEKALKADLARERKARQELATKLQEIEDAKLSELERAKKEADQLRTDLETARTEALRNRIAIKHGISEDDAETFLTGSTEEQLTKQAERLAALAAAEDKKPKRPAPDKSQGARSSDAVNPGSAGLAEAQKRFGHLSKS